MEHGSHGTMMGRSVLVPGTWAFVRAGADQVPVPDVTALNVPWLPTRVQRWIAPLLRVPPLRPWRIAAAFVVAVSLDAAQLLLGPLGWSIADQVLDLVAMVLTIWLLGFHVLLLPTFLIELLPVADMLPTWTGCVGLVVAHRRSQLRGKSDATRPAES